MCEFRSARAKEEDEMAKWQRWERGVRRRSYKALPTLSYLRVFGKPLLQFALLHFLRNTKVGRYLGFRATMARIADLSPQFVMARRIFTDFFANRYGSVITTI